MEKAQQGGGDNAKCQNFGTNFKFCQNRELRADYLETVNGCSKDVKMASCMSVNHLCSSITKNFHESENVGFLPLYRVKLSQI